MTGIELKQLQKHFGVTRAVDSIDLTVEPGELFFLLGPSGCGKTTLLRMIAGFIDPTGGTILFGDRDVTHLAPNKRNTGMVFQSYALWPHMTVAENVAYGLKIRKISASEQASRVQDALELVQMGPYGDRKPTQLSGGQQQRVALARALVVKPSVLLLDEPLSNLDAKLRLEMRTEIRRICKDAGMTTVYVTHDQKEALSMADRIAVLSAGKLVQAGPPRALYEAPATRFVADFLGESNFLDARVTAVDGDTVVLETAAGPLHSTGAGASGGWAVGDQVICSIRPETVRFDDAAQAGTAPTNRLSGVSAQSIYLGELGQHAIRINDNVLLRSLELAPGPFPPDGSAVTVQVAPQDVVVLPAGE